MRKKRMLSTALALVTLLVGAGVLAGCGETQAGQEVEAQKVEAQKITLVIESPIAGSTTHEEDVLSPENFAVQPGRPVEVSATNNTLSAHTFHAPGLNIAQVVGPESTLDFTFTPDEAGVFTWSCLSCIDHMAGEVYVIGGDDTQPIIEDEDDQP